MQKNKCYGKYIILGVFYLLILSCNMLPMSNALTKTEEEKSFSTQANINTPELKTIPDFRFNEEDDAVETKGTAYLSAGMIQNNPPVEELFVYNSADDYFYYAPYLYYFIDKREVKLSGSFKATFIEKTKSYFPPVGTGVGGRYSHNGEVTIEGSISGTPDSLKFDFSSSRLYKSTSLINFNGCDYTHTNVMRGGNFSGSAFLLGGNLYISGNLSGQGAVDAGGWCASHPSSQKPMSANFSMKSYVKEKPPVKVEVIANKEKTGFYKTNGKEKIRIEVTALNETRWRLEIKGYDDDNNPRTYYLDGSGNQDIDWDGKTNDALNPQDDVFFADSYTSNAILIRPLDVKLTSADGMGSIAKIVIDNTAPEIKINKIEGNVIKGVINDVTEIDKASLPKEFTDGDKRISITYSDNPNPPSYRLDSKNTVNFKSLIFEAKVYGFDSSETSYMKDLKYKLSGFLQDSVKDKLGNAYPTISVDGESTPVENTNPDNQMQVQALNIPYLVGELAARYAWKRFKNAHYGTGIYAPAEYRIGTGKPFVFRPVIGVGDYFQIRQGEYDVKASIRIVKEVNKKEYYGVNFLPYVGKVYSKTKYGANTGIIELDKREWFGSIRNVTQDAMSTSESILKSYERYPDEINRIFAGPPFAINDVKDAGVNHKIKLYLEYVRKPRSETNIRGQDYFEADLRIINEFQDYNRKFLNGKLYGQDELPYRQSVTRNPYPISDERKLHIKERHSMNILNPTQFVKGYVSKFADNPAHATTTMLSFCKKKSSAAYKSSCWNYQDLENNEYEMFKSIRSVAEMEDIYDHFKKDEPTNLVIVGKRAISYNNHEHIIDALLDKNYNLGTAFPDEKSTNDMIITEANQYKLNNPVNQFLLSMLESKQAGFIGIADNFEKYVEEATRIGKSLNSIDDSLTFNSDNYTGETYKNVQNGKQIYEGNFNPKKHKYDYVYKKIKKTDGKLVKK